MLLFWKPLRLFLNLEYLEGTTILLFLISFHSTLMYNCSVFPSTWGIHKILTVSMTPQHYAALPTTATSSLERQLREENEDVKNISKRWAFSFKTVDGTHFPLGIKRINAFKINIVWVYKRCLKTRKESYSRPGKCRNSLKYIKHLGSYRKILYTHENTWLITSWLSHSTLLLYITWEIWHYHLYFSNEKYEFQKSNLRPHS